MNKIFFALAILVTISIHGQEIMTTDSIVNEPTLNSYSPKTHNNAILFKWTGVGVATIGGTMSAKEETRELGVALMLVGGLSTFISSIVQDIQAIRHGKEFKPLEKNYKDFKDEDKSLDDTSLFNHGKIYGIRKEPKLFKIIEFANIDGEKLMLISFRVNRFYPEEVWIGYEDYEIEWIDQSMRDKAFNYFSSD